MSQEVSKTAAQMVGEAKQRVENLTPQQAAAEVDSGGALLVDLRESEERRQSGAIPKALHASRGMLEFYADPTSSYHKPEFELDRRIILHCASGGRSALGADALQQMGYKNVAHVDGGIKAWKEAGLPVEEVRSGS